MINLLIILSFSFAAVMTPLAVFAKAEQGQKSETAQKSELVEVGNKICPVSGEEIKEDEAVKVEYKGKVYNLCCKMCKRDFKKNPEKYIKIIEEGMKE